ncbi:hypothetical protein OG339_16460 [Streptosporangium sp. NBC_01495]|uniref:hypothetical protein n=1 Tax=Streptosporangium sp. NBC_01495 TaxID=2903899 RepID=UPI002E31F291|nr:hypothetical protein [Streptosporangium sp. NBC_01495]
MRSISQVNATNQRPSAQPSLPSREVAGGGRARWDGQDLRALTGTYGFTGTYGECLLAKVSKVFPRLREDVL